MGEEKAIQKNIGFTTSIVQGAMIWFLGWIMFAGVEIVSRLLNWFPLASFVPVLMIVLYAGLGAVAGGAVGAFSFLALKSLGKRVQNISR